MANLPIDLETDSVQYEGTWYTREELAKKIKGQLEAGDYAISKPSQALEYLTQQLADAETLSFKVPGELADAITAAAARQGRPVGVLLREVLTSALSTLNRPVGRRPTDPEIPISVAEPLTSPSVAVVPAPVPTPAPMTAVGLPVVPPPSPASVPPGLSPSPAVMAGPGALRNAMPHHEAKVIIDSSVSPEEAASAVDLKPKKKDDADAVERRWFGS